MVTFLRVPGTHSTDHFAAGNKWNKGWGGCIQLCSLVQCRVTSRFHRWPHLLSAQNTTWLGLMSRQHKTCQRWGWRCDGLCVGGGGALPAACCLPSAAYVLCGVSWGVAGLRGQRWPCILESLILSPQLRKTTSALARWNTTAVPLWIDKWHLLSYISHHCWWGCRFGTTYEQMINNV